MQQALLELENPLDITIGRAFFSEIPKCPGIYKMYDDAGHLLYVGKAKNLRSRLMSYRRIKITTSSRKSLRLIHQVSTIQWENCESETAALLLENRLLRRLKPPFNVVNTKPETYFYFSIKILEADGHRVDSDRSFLPSLSPEGKASCSRSISERIPVGITLTMNPTDPDAAVFGAFKGIASSQRAFFALRRLLWLVHEQKEHDELYYPLHLIRRQRLHPHQCTIEKPWLNALAGYFHGMSLRPTETEPELILRVRAHARRIRHCDTFHANWIENDIDALLKFYRIGPKRNASLKSFSEIDSAVIEQHQVDDLLVKRLFARRESEN